MCFSNCMSTLEKCSRWPCAILLLSTLGLEANVVHFNCGLSAGEKALQWPRAVGLWEAMPVRRLAADVVSLNSLLEQCGRWQVALRLLCSCGAANRGSATAKNLVKTC